MILTLCGLHSSGKSHLADLLEREFGWSCVNKRVAIERLFNKQFDAPDSPLAIEWFRAIYQNVGAAELMTLVLGSIPDGSNVVFDSVHNPLEWDVIKASEKKSMLVGVFAPQAVRDERNSQLDVVLDKKRIRYWHDDVDSNFRCLMSEVEWAFCGAHDEALQKEQCGALISYLQA